MTEHYETIDGYENYSVSTLGNVRNDTTGKILKQAIEFNGYHRVGLTKNKKQNMFYIQRLVALTFIPLIEGLENVHHIDRNKSNNNASNLEWMQDPETIDGHKAYINIDNVMYNLGYFKTKQEATHAKNINNHITTHEQLLQYRSSNK